jgi:hypothetical protein
MANIIEDLLLLFLLLFLLVRHVISFSLPIS